MDKTSLIGSTGTQASHLLPAPGAPGSSGTEELEWFRREFRPRFDEWVFGPIDRLATSADALVAFILMACAVDYLAGFWWGKRIKANEGRIVYTSFINQYFPSGRYDALGLYKSLRNGLVHMFTVKGQKYTLTHNNPGLHRQTARSGQIVLNAADFRDDLVAAKDSFFDDVEKKPELLARLIDRYTRDGFLDRADIEVV